MGHEKVARLPFAFAFGYCINFCIYAMLRTRSENRNWILVSGQVSRIDRFPPMMIAACTHQIGGLVAPEMLLTLCKENNVLILKGMESFSAYRTMGLAT